MKIIVSGADGFVGKNIIAELLNQKHPVVALVREDRGDKKLSAKRFESVVCNLAEYQKMNVSSGMKNADVFFHLAWDGTSGPKRANLETQVKNVVATRDAVDLAHRCGCRRFVFAGSIMEYEALEYVGSDLSTPPASYIYSCLKLTADHIARIETQKLGMEYIALIISNIFGPNEKSPRFINTLVRKMVNNERIALTEGLQKYDFIYMSDATKAICLAGLHGKANCNYYIGNKDQKILREYVEEAKECIGSRSVLDFGAIPYFGPISAYQWIDTQRLEREFQFKPEFSFHDGIKRILTFEEDLP